MALFSKQGGSSMIHRRTGVESIGAEVRRGGLSILELCSIECSKAITVTIRPTRGMIESFRHRVYSGSMRTVTTPATPEY
jgi:hypothetical protein